MGFARFFRGTAQPVYIVSGTTDDPAPDGSPLSTAPVSSAIEVTPNDSTDLDTPGRGLYVGTSGDVAVIHVDDTDPVTYPNLAAGIYHAIAVKRVLATGTTATGIVVVIG